ncbi:MAG: GGDEF domain-containing protein [Clostridia bacterium]|nr:GGDEF domain-containing protein [Clostridia bacterium]
MVLKILSENMVALFLMLLFGIRLLNKKSFKDTETKYFWLTLISSFLLVFEDTFEATMSLYPALRFWRIVLSIIGYTLRSTAALGLLLVILPRKNRSVLWWIPCAITFLINCTALFSDVAFGFDEEYAFYRGPLGIVSFIVPLFYILIILVFSFRRLSEKNGTGKYIIPMCILFCVAATVKGVLSGGHDLNAAIISSSIFFYIVLYSHDNRLDPLTGILNRQAYYDDCTAHNKSIKAVASLDMNGLKDLNDSRGHQFGDEALKKIGLCLRSFMNGKMSAYRIGGDEFAILFFHDNEEEIAGIENKIKEMVAVDGYSISAGYAVCGKDRDLDKTIEEADRLMYEDKANYYQTSGIERRKNRTPKTHD